jgi:hypothetical protein
MNHRQRKISRSKLEIFILTFIPHPSAFILSFYSLLNNSAVVTVAVPALPTTMPEA